MTKFCDIINGTTYNSLLFNNRRFTKEAAAPPLDRPTRITITLHNNIIVDIVVIRASNGLDCTYCKY